MFKADPLYYYTKVKVKDVVRETELAYNLEVEDSINPIWVPKSLCKKQGLLKRGTIYIQTEFYKNKLSEVSHQQSYLHTKHYIKKLREFKGTLIKPLLSNKRKKNLSENK